MKQRSMKSIRGGAVILAVLLAAAALRAAPSQNKDLDQFFKVKTSVFNQDWSAVRSGMEAYLRDHPAGKMRDEALYWLGRGLDRLARQAKDRAEIVALKTEAAETLDRMIKEFPESPWRDDARELRLTIAGELAILGVAAERTVVEAAVRAQGKSEVELRRIALSSLVRLDAATVLPVMEDFLRTEPDPGLRKAGVSLLGRRFTRPVVGLLESVAEKDASEDVRREAAYWLAKIKTRLIPLQLNYYCYEARLTDASASGQVPEGRIASFSPAHGRPGSEGRVKAEIGRIFGGRVALRGSKATSMGAANIYEIMRIEGTTIRTSHRISGFIVGLDGGSIVKTEAGISGQVVFDGEAADFAVNGRNDALLAARQGDRLALMYLEMAPKTTESPEDADAEGSSAGRESFFGSLGKLFRSTSKEPVYYTKNVLSRSGLVIWSTLQSMNSVEVGVTDYSLAKAEIPGPGGAWILTGHILREHKEDILIGRMAKLVKPDGKVAAEGDEIRVPVKDPAAFTTPGGTAVPAPAPAPAAGVASADEAKFPVSFDLDGGGRIFSPRKQFRLAELSGDAVDLGAAKAVLPGRGGNWVLTGRLVLLGKQGMITAREAVLLNAEGKVAAEGTVLMVPVKKPEAFTVAAARHK